MGNLFTKEFVDKNDDRFFVLVGPQKVDARTNVLVSTNDYCYKNLKTKTITYGYEATFHPTGAVSSGEYTNRGPCETAMNNFRKRWRIARNFAKSVTVRDTNQIQSELDAANLKLAMLQKKSEETHCEEGGF